MNTQLEIQKTEQRDKMLQRIINLRQRAENDGSSEAEMNTALTMAMKLMDSYNVAEAELALAEADGRIKLEIITEEADTTVMKSASRKHKILLVLGSINSFCEVKSIYSSSSGIVTFTGNRPDVQLANFLLPLIKEALDREYETYRNSMTAVGYGAKSSFQNAMASRVSSRLHEMTRERSNARAAAKAEAILKIESGEIASSAALIISDIAEQKQKEVSSAFFIKYPRIRTVSTMSRSNNRTAHGAGATAGDRVNLGRAINQGNGQKALA